MDRQTLHEHIRSTYGVTADYPWEDKNAVYRHKDNKKWFALIMDIPKSKLGIADDEIVSVVNLKCGPLLSGSLLGDEGIHPAYHMNKAHWITLRLDSSVPDDKVLWLLDISHNLTEKKNKPKNK